MAVVSPFAQIQDSLPPLTPAPQPISLADLQGLGGAQTSPSNVFASAAPKVSLDQNPAHQIKGAFANGNPSEGIQLHEQQQLGKDYEKDADPYGSADNHPGFWGKIAHGLNVATGGVNRRNFEEMGLQKSLQELLKEQSTEAEQGATASHLNAETPEVAPNAESLRKEQGAQTENLESETRDRDLTAAQGPPLASAYAHAVNEALKAGRDPSQDPIVQQLSDAITSIQKQTAPKGGEHVDLVGSNGKPIAASYDPATKQYMDASGKVIQNPVPYEKPNQAGMVTLIAPDPNNPGGGIVERVGAGAKITPGSQTTAGFNAMNTPTTNQRTASGRAENVLAMVPEVTSRLDAMKGQIGPEMGRWNEFMQGKVGTSNPQFAALRSDLLMMSSAVALAHAQGRLPENLREEFDNAINAPKQTPENLKATINTMVPWLEQVRDQGERPGTPHASPTNEPQRPANVPEGYVFKDGPKGKGWYKP